MVNAFNLLFAAVLAGSVIALPVYRRDSDDSGFDLSGLLGLAGNSTDDQSGTGIPPGFGADNQNAAHDAQVSAFAAAATAAAAAEAAAGIDITASIASASSSAAAVATTFVSNPADPFNPNTFGLNPEQLGQLAGLKTKLAIDTQFNDSGAITQDFEDINALESLNEGSGF
ncbi:hypothetical protein C8R44DRAFT_856112 [Mycena epipterygia]|nr:hypothetical protein C8R44DRAFT_856112 [Mycena epipterygia]